jgi:predicted SAM-dependent methyltransferase
MQASEKNLQEDSAPTLLNLACGSMRLPGYVNIDIDEKCKPDMVLRIEDIKEVFEPDSVDSILLVHGLGYLSLESAREFFKDAFRLLKTDGSLVIETPDAAKISSALNSIDMDEYISAVFALLAVDSAGLTHGSGYRFAWSGSFLLGELRRTGFQKIILEAPRMHGARQNRDLRCIAHKSQD